MMKLLSMCFALIGTAFITTGVLCMIAAKYTTTNSTPVDRWIDRLIDGREAREGTYR